MDQNIKDLLGELQSEADAPTLTWVPDAEEPQEGWLVTPTVSGVIIGVVHYTAKATQNTYPIYSLRAADGSEILVHASRTVLRRELEDYAIGDAVGIRFTGRVEREEQSDYFGYKVSGRRLATAADEADDAPAIVPRVRTPKPDDEWGAPPATEPPPDEWDDHEEAAS